MKKEDHSRLSSLSKNLLPQLASSSSLDGVQRVVDPVRKRNRTGEVSFLTRICPLRRGMSGQGKKSTHSSAPSIVTSIRGNWSISPSSRPAETMSSLDWNPRDERNDKPKSVQSRRRSAKPLDNECAPDRDRGSSGYVLDRVQSKPTKGREERRHEPVGRKTRPALASFPWAWIASTT